MKILDKHIEKELWRHRESLQGRNVLVMDESPSDGVFSRHLSRMYDKFGLRGLSCVSYGSQQLEMFGESVGSLLNIYDNVGHAWITKSVEGYGGFSGEWLQGILGMFDFVIAVPDSSEFGTYVSVLDRRHIKFILLGHITKVFDDSVFRLFKEDRIHFGFTLKGEYVSVVEDYKGEVPDWNRTDLLLSGENSVRLQNLRWYCNTGLTNYRHRFTYYYRLVDTEFEKFDNIDALNVPDYHNIPLDYGGLVGTSPLFLDVMRRDEFDLVCNHKDIDGGVRFHGKLYPYRIFVRRH